MAKIKKRAKADLSAMTSDQVLMEKYGNRTLVSAANPRKKSNSPDLKRTNDRMKQAARWAKATLLDPAMTKLYSKGITEDLTNAQIVAVTDFMTAPKISYVRLEDYTGHVGNTIRIRATDDFRVVGVTVTISNGSGKLEEGAALRNRRKPKMWSYTTTVANPELPGTIVVVKAMDLPGNVRLHETTIGAEGDQRVYTERSEVMLCNGDDYGDG
jgi:hypothetical protein